MPTTKHEGNEKEDLKVVKSRRARQNGMVTEQDAHPFLLDEVFVGSALSMLDMNSVDACVSITGPVVVGETGVEVEGGGVVLDEREEEDEVTELCKHWAHFIRCLIGRLVPRSISHHTTTSNSNETK